MCLYPLAGLASFNMFSNIMLNSGPPIITGDEFCSFVMAQVSSERRIMIFADNVFSKFGMNGNVNTLSEGDKSIFQFLPTFFFIA
jgi:hypothetical protein